MHTEDDLLPISALQHLLFCERQTALIHLERQWVENRFTAEGRVLHRNADAAKSETRDGVRITRGLPVQSFELGLYGVCDVVNFKPPEFETPGRMSLAKRIERQLRLARADVRDAHERVGSLFPNQPEAAGSPDVEMNEYGLANSRKKKTSDPVPVDSQTEAGDSPDVEMDEYGSAISERKKTPDPVPANRRSTAFAHWTITPVEYKRGKPKTNDCDRVQLTAQAMCLEEMLGVSIESGDLFYGKRQRRTEVRFDDPLRQLTADGAARLHQLIASRQTPSAAYEKKCDTCSLLPVCMPPKGDRSAESYLSKMIR